MEQEAAPESAAGDDGRATVRESMLLTGTIRRANGEESPIRVRNLSAGGLMAEVVVGFLAHEAVEIELRGLGCVAGSIAWLTGKRIGVTFAREVDPRLARRKVLGLPQPMLVRAVTSSWRPAVR